MDLKNKLFALYIRVKLRVKFFSHCIAKRLGLIQPEIHSREYYLELLKKLKSALKRKDSIIREMETLRYQIASSGTVTPKELLDLNFDTLIAHTEGDFGVFGYEILALEECLDSNLYANELGIKPNYSKYIKSFEDSFNRKIILLKHLQKLTKISLYKFPKDEKRQLSRELKLALK